MPGAPGAQAIPIGGQRQVNAKARHTVGLNQHTAVMARCLGIEEAEDQLLGEPTVEMNPAFQVPATIMARDNYGSDTLGVT